MYHHITRDDRATLASMRRAGYSLRTIARTIGYDVSTLSRELRRNTRKAGYHAASAHKQAVMRRIHSKHGTRILENDPILAKRIIQTLDPLTSPEVVGHLFGIAHATIYAWIRRSRPDLYVQLPQRGKKRRRYGTKRSIKQGWTRHVRPIADIPVEQYINAWEGDTVRGTGKKNLLTHVHRKSLFTVTNLIDDGCCDTVYVTRKAQRALHNSIIIDDRGSEFALWAMLERDIGCTVYFAQPHHPWQRGKNENGNQRWRRLYPKRTNFDTVSSLQIQKVAWKMNHTPRKTLDWKTPCEVYGKCCTSS